MDAATQASEPSTPKQPAAYVFITLLRDPDDANGLSRLLEDVKIPEPEAAAAFVAPPMLGLDFLIQRESPELTQWWRENVPVEAKTVFLLFHEPGLPEHIATLPGVSYVGVPNPAMATAYEPFAQVTTFMAGGPLDFATVIMRDFSEPGAPQFFDPGEAVRMAALSSDFPLDLDDSAYGDAAAANPFVRGTSLYAEGKYEEAITAFDQAIARGGDDLPLIHLWRADAFEHLHQPEQAAADCRAALDECDRLLARQPADLATIHTWRGDALAGLERYAEAATAYREALKSAPGDVRLYRSLAVALIDAQQFKDAIATINTAIRLQPEDAVAHQIRAALLIYNGDYQQALQDCEAALQFGYRQPERVYYYQGLAFHNLHQHDEALAAYRKALRKAKGNPQIYLNLGLLLDTLGRYSEAKQACEQAIQLWRAHEDEVESDDVEGIRHAYICLAHSLSQMGQYHDSEIACREVIARGDSSDTVCTLLAYNLAQLGHPDQAEEWARRPLRAESAASATEWWRVYALLGTIQVAVADLFHDDSYDDAVETLSTAIRRVPRRKLTENDRDTIAELFLRRGYANGNAGNTRAAKLDFAEAIKRSPRPDSAVRLASRRQLRQVRARSRQDMPRVVPVAITLADLGLLVYVVAQSSGGRLLTNNTYVALLVALLVVPLIAFSLPAITRLRWGGVELQKDDVTIKQFTLSLAGLSPVISNLALPAVSTVSFQNRPRSTVRSWRWEQVREEIAVGSQR